jgi:hypothetical protein
MRPLGTGHAVSLFQVSTCAEYLRASASEYDAPNFLGIFCELRGKAK